MDSRRRFGDLQGIFESALHGLELCGSYNSAISFWNEMRHTEIPPTQQICESMLRVYLTVGDLEEASHVIERGKSFESAAKMSEHFAKRSEELGGASLPVCKELPFLCESTIFAIQQRRKDEIAKCCEQLGTAVALSYYTKIMRKLIDFNAHEAVHSVVNWLVSTTQLTSSFAEDTLSLLIQHEIVDSVRGVQCAVCGVRCAVCGVCVSSCELL
jgi:hypothetical protein